MKRITHDTIGEIERRSPMPVGTYWQDLIGDKAVIWHAIIRGLNKDKQRVQLLVTEEYPAEGDAPARTWVKFKVLTPIYWDHLQMGSPTIADATVNTSDDTVTKPEVPGVLDTLTAPASGLMSGLALPAKVLVWSLVGMVAVGGVTLIWRAARPRTRIRETSARSSLERIR